MIQRLPLPQRGHKRWGRPDYFDARRKSILVRLADMKPTDIFYEMGCGDASLLIYVVKASRLRKAVGFENMPSRARRALINVRRAGLQDRITIESDMYDANLKEADVIFDMMIEGINDIRALYGGNKGIRSGTRLIKHDLPLVGYLPDKVDFPFYSMTFPLRKASTRDEWAKAVLDDSNGTVESLWHELLYYCYEKGYARSEILQLYRMLRKRIRPS
jgi:hypothetical protein